MRTVTLWRAPSSDLHAVAERLLQASGAKLKAEVPPEAEVAASLKRTRMGLRCFSDPRPSLVLLQELDLPVRLWRIRSIGDEDIEVAVIGGTPGFYECGTSSLGELPVAHEAFSFAAMNARRRVTIASAGNESFRTVALDAAKDYPAIMTEEREPDALSEELEVVLCAPDRAEALVRKLAGASIVTSTFKGESVALFEPFVDGDPPLGTLLALGLLLEHANEHQAAARLDRAIGEAVEEKASPLPEAVLSRLSPR